MPLYDYLCRKCGPFREWRSLSAYAEPARCPDCGKTAHRSIATPMLGMRDGALRKAHEINEKSAHEPRVVRRKRGDPIPGHDAHRDLTEAHRHRHAHHHGPGGKEGPQRSSHPWAIKH